MSVRACVSLRVVKRVFLVCVRVELLLRCLLSCHECASAARKWYALVLGLIACTENFARLSA